MISIGKYLYQESIGRLFSAALIHLFDDSTFSKTQYRHQTILYLNKELDESFTDSAIEALKLIEETSSVLEKVVSRNIKYIIGKNHAAKKALALYNKNLDGCTINWSALKNHSPLSRIPIMAGALVHEAYHGECYKIYGCKVYETEPFEKICRTREFRVLNKLISADSCSELSDRINYLKNNINRQNHRVDLTR